jgi:predicted transcriptional regulator
MVVSPPDITDKELDCIAKVKNGHSRKIMKRSIIARRNTLHTLMSKGLNQYQCAAILGCSQETVSGDQAYLRSYFREQMRYYVQDRLPELWESCLTNLHSCMAAISKISQDPNISTHDRLHSLSLLADCSQMKLSLISDATIIQEALRFIDQTKQRIVEIVPEQTRELLHKQQEQETQQELNESNKGNDSPSSLRKDDTMIHSINNEESLSRTDPYSSSSNANATNASIKEVKDDDQHTTNSVF